MAERGPALVVAACIVEGEQVLLARRNQPTLPEAHLRWELPGGKVKVGESLQAALEREIFEELGTTIQVVRLLPHVQSNIYHRPDGTIAYSVVLAFESVVLRGVPRPRPIDTAVAELRWARRAELRQLDDLLPGTAEFVQCLDKLDQASLEGAHIYVRLKRHRPGPRTDYWELQCVYDLWGDFHFLERHVNLETKSTHTKLIRDMPQATCWHKLTSRMCALARHGYVVSDSGDTRVSPGLSLA